MNKTLFKEKNYIEELVTLIRSDIDEQSLIDKLSNYHNSDIAETLVRLTPNERKNLYNILGAQRIAEILPYSDDTELFFNELSIDSAAKVISLMDSDDAVDVLGDLDDEKKREIVKRLDFSSRNKVKMLLSYDEEEIAEGDVRTVLHLSPVLAPYKAAVLPLSKKLSDKATEVYEDLSKKFNIDYDEAGSIGKRYRREDEIGTPYCITVDFDTLEDNTVTIRDRDTMEQIRLPISELEKYIEEKIKF